MKKPLLIGLFALAGIGAYFGYQAMNCGPGCCQASAEATGDRDVATASLVANDDVIETYGIGSVAANFTLKNAQNDKMESLNDLKGENGAIVIFTCNTCPYAVMYEDRINELHAEFEGKGYPVIAINPNDPEIKPGDSFAAMKTRIADKGFKFPYLFDATQEIYPVWGATKTPHVFLLDTKNVIKYIGAIDDNAQDAASVNTKYVAAAISAVTAGNDPSPAETKAIGCSIKAKKKM